MKNKLKYQYHVYDLPKNTWRYNIYKLNKNEPYIIANEYFETKERAEFAAIGHISLIEKGEREC